MPVPEAFADGTPRLYYGLIYVDTKTAPTSILFRRAGNFDYLKGRVGKFRVQDARASGYADPFGC